MGFIIFEVIFFAVLLVADLLSKHFVFLFYPKGSTKVVIEGVLTFHTTMNSGASLGIFSGKTGLLIGITIASMVILLGIIVLLHIKKLHSQPTGRFLLCSLLMILSGGIANLYDRILFGSVRDFIQYTFLETIFGSSFFTCNVADIWVCVGVVLIIIYILFMYKEKKPETVFEPESINESDDEENIKKALEMLDENDEDSDKTE